MPPKKPPRRKNTTFLTPGTPASVSRARKAAPSTLSTAPLVTDPPCPPTTVATPQPPQRSNASRNLEAELDAIYGSREELMQSTIVFDRRHVRPLAPNSIRKHNDAKRLWLAFFGRLLGPEGAEATLQKDAALPPLAHVKKFFHFVATNAVSGLGLGKGWTNRTTTIFISRTFSMRARLGAIAPTADDRIQLNAAVSEWAVVDKSLTTAALAKRSIREVDLAEFLNATLKSSIRFANNLGRIQTGCFASLLYSTGQRPGGVIEAQEYQNSNQHLKWKHTEWLATGWDEGAGLAVQCFITFHFMKNMRNSDADFVIASTRSLGRSRIHLDSQLPLMALGIAAGVFKTDLLQLHELGPGNMPAQFPFAIELHPNKASLPVFVSPADKASPWSYNGAQKAMQMVARELGWQHFSLRSFRYAFAGAMSSVIPKGHLKYLMGHRYGSKLAMTTYQVPDRPIDMSGARFSGEGNMTDITDWHSSVAYGRTEPTMTTETLEKDAAMNELLKELHTLEKAVFQEFGRSSSDVPEEHLDSPSVQAALTKWSDIMQHYADMEARGNRGVLPAEILSSHKRRSASVSSAGSSMSTTSDNLKHRPRQSRSTSTVSQTPSTPQPRSSSQSSASSAMSGVSAACRSVSTHQRSQSATSDASQQTAWHHRSASTSSSLSNMSDVIATAPPMSLPPRNAPFSDSVPQIDDETLMNDILETINSFGSMHAFLPVIDNEPENPRLAVLQRYLTLLKADDLKDAGVCMWCYSNETLSKAAREKVHTDHLSEHMWGCQKTHNPDMWLCPVCTMMVVELTADETDSDIVAEALEQHQEECYETVLALLDDRLNGTAEDVDGDDLTGSDVSSGSASSRKKKGKQPKVLSSAARLSACTLFGDSRRGFRRLFCPLCLFNPDISWNNRFLCFLTEMNLYQHMHSHWSDRTGKSRTGLTYKREFVCRYPPCDEKFSTTAGIITHLHSCHGYSLVVCTRNHHTDSCDQGCRMDHHTPSCDLELRGSFRYTSDAELDKALANIAIPPVSLIDRRKTDMRNRAHKKITDAHPKPSPAEDAANQPGASAPPTPVPDVPSPPPTTDGLPAEPSADADSAELFKCLQAFKSAYPKLKEVDYYSPLVNEEMTVLLVKNCTAVELRGIIEGLTLGAAKSLIEFAKQWNN